MQTDTSTEQTDTQDCAIYSTCESGTLHSLGHPGLEDQLPDIDVCMNVYVDVACVRAHASVTHTFARTHARTHARARAHTHTQAVFVTRTTCRKSGGREEGIWGLSWRWTTASTMPCRSRPYLPPLKARPSTDRNLASRTRGERAKGGKERVGWRRRRVI